MKGDFTRDTFARVNHFSQVLMQQGRVTLDADHNEQTNILLGYLRTLARDLIGPYAAPAVEGGFLVTQNGADVLLSAGRYYVDGILVENEATVSYAAQPFYTPPANDPFLLECKQKSGREIFWLYLDVWERYVTFLDTGCGHIRETALGGPDTCGRAQVVWQVRALTMDTPVGNERNPLLRDRLIASQNVRLLDLEKQATATKDPAMQAEATLLHSELQVLKKDPRAGLPSRWCSLPLGRLEGVCGARLAARIDPGPTDEGPCITPPASKYRGPENQLYRVEIHDGGTAEEATFKWSRDNGSTVTVWTDVEDGGLQVSKGHGFAPGDWVEISGDADDMAGTPGVLLEITGSEAGVLQVATDAVLPDITKYINPKIRRWNQRDNDEIDWADGVVRIKSGSGTPDGWIDLEDGVQIRFAPDGDYRTGDFWLIPARVATGGIEWPLAAPGSDDPPFCSPHGVQHHYAPLGFVRWADREWEFAGCRCVFQPLMSCALVDSAPPRVGWIRATGVPDEIALAAEATVPVVTPVKPPRIVRTPKKRPK